MSIITTIDLGAIPNDGTGDPLRVGGQEINDNFAALNTDKLETGGYVGNAQDLKNLIDLSMPVAIYDPTNVQQDVFNPIYSNFDSAGLTILTKTNVQEALEQADGVLTNEAQTGVRYGFATADGALGVATTFSYGNIRGEILDLTDPVNPVYANVNVPAASNIAFVDNQTTYYYVDAISPDTLQATAVEPNETDKRTRAYVFRVIGRDGAIRTIASERNLSQQNSATARELYRFIGDGRISGLQPNSAGPDLTWSITAGVILGYDIDPFVYTDPHTKETPSFDTSVSDTYLVATTSGVIDTPETLVKVTQRQDGAGNLVTIGNNQYGVWYVVEEFDSQRVFLVPEDQDFASIALAEDSLTKARMLALAPAGFDRDFVVGAMIVLKEVTNLQTGGSSNVFITTNRFGVFGEGSISSAPILGSFFEIGNSLSEGNAAQIKINLGLDTAALTDTTNTFQLVQTFDQVLVGAGYSIPGGTSDELLTADGSFILLSGLGAPSGLEAIDEGNGVGWRFIGKDPANYGNIGLNAVDLSQSDLAGNYGAIGARDFAAGAAPLINLNVTGSVDNNVYLQGPTINVPAASGFTFNFIGGSVTTNVSGEYNFMYGKNLVLNDGALNNGNAVFGEGNIISESWSFMAGSGNRSSGFGQVVAGFTNFGRSTGEVALGAYGTDYTDVGDQTDRLFNLGNGTGAGTPSDAFTVLKNAQTGIGITDFFNTTTGELLQVGGTGKFAGTLTIGDITIQTADGSAGQVLATDGAGNVAFKTDLTSWLFNAEGAVLDAYYGPVLTPFDTLVNTAFISTTDNKASGFFARNSGVGTAAYSFLGVTNNALSDFDDSAALIKYGTGYTSSYLTDRTALYNSSNDFYFVGADTSANFKFVGGLGATPDQENVQGLLDILTTGSLLAPSLTPALITSGGNTSLITKEFLDDALALKADLAGATFTGNIAAPQLTATGNVIATASIQAQAGKMVSSDGALGANITTLTIQGGAGDNTRGGGVLFRNNSGSVIGANYIFNSRFRMGTATSQGWDFVIGNAVVGTVDTGRFKFSDGVIATKNYTVATLPTGAQGDMAYVTDATAPTYLGTLTGGGSVVCPVFFDGTNWVSH